MVPLTMAYVDEAIRDAGRTANVLDVGPGYGKYGLLVREYCAGRFARLDAVEAEERYVRSFPWLFGIYQHLDVMPVAELPDEVLADYDVVLMLDVIEHLERDAALTLLERIRGFVIISTPRDYFETEESKHGWPTETHVSHWAASDFGDRVDREDVYARDTLGGVLVRLRRQ